MKTIFFYIFSISFILVFLLNSCENDCLRSAGEIDSITIELDSFSDIHVYDMFNVYVQQADNYSVKIKTNSTLLKNVIVNNDTALVISDDNKCYFARNSENHIDIFITTPELSHLSFYSASTFYSIDTLKFHRFSFRAFGKLAFADFNVICEDHLFVSMWNVSGNLKVGGECKYFQVLNHGSTYIDAFELNSQFAKIEQRSSGDAKVNVSNELTAEIFDIGNVFYKGNPVIDTIITSSGKLIDAN
ncbi:MAG: DUF2807 domain-containing protein [Bacteroidales bacterium]|nr:DUF2807 domain-containing protein [Bacteroidales bacterium]